jgi:hypothetical protein
MEGFLSVYQSQRNDDFFVGFFHFCKGVLFIASIWKAKIFCASFLRIEIQFSQSAQTSR